MSRPRNKVGYRVPLDEGALRDEFNNCFGQVLRALEQDVFAAGEASSRRRTIPRVVWAALRHLQADRLEHAEQLLQEAASKDPDLPVYPLLLSGVRAWGGRHQEALEALAAPCLRPPLPGDVSLDGYVHLLRMRFAAERMRPARDALKQGDHAAARAHLEKLDNTCRETPLCRTFDRYVAAVARRRPRKLGELTPQGTGEEVEALYCFLFGEEIRRASVQVNENVNAQAAKLLAEVLEGAPDSSHVRFLYADCRYRILCERLEKEADYSPERALADLERIRADAEQAAEGAADGETAAELARHLAETRKDIESAREDERVRGYVQACRRLRAAAREGAVSAAQLVEAQRLRDELQRYLDDLGRGPAHHEQREAVALLIDALERLLAALVPQRQALEQQELELERIAALERQFQTTRHYFEILTEEHVKSLGLCARLQTTLNGARELSGASSAPEALARLDRLITAIRQLQQQRCNPGNPM